MSDAPEEQSAHLAVPFWDRRVILQHRAPSESLRPVQLGFVIAPLGRARCLLKHLPHTMPAPWGWHESLLLLCLIWGSVWGLVSLLHVTCGAIPVCLALAVTCKTSPNPGVCAWRGGQGQAACVTLVCVCVCAS